MDTEPKPELKKFVSEWEHYVAAVYPGGMVPNQEIQLRAAFYAGAFNAMQMCKMAGRGLPLEEAQLYVRLLDKEIKEGCENIAGGSTRGN